MELNKNFYDISEEEMMTIDGGGWYKAAKAFTGTLLVAGGFVLCFTPVGPINGVAVMSLGATGIYSCK